MEIKVKQDYRKLREKAYQLTGDQLDAIYKGFRAIEKTIELPPETKAWLEQIDTVKSTFKKAGEK